MKTFLGATLSVAVIGAPLVIGVNSAGAASIPEPKTFGTSFQPDPKHDFTKQISSRRDGILRGWVTYYAGGVAEYEPIKWVKGTKTEGHFEGPPEGDVTAYASPVSAKVKFLSATGCKGTTVTAHKSLGTKSCPRKVLISRMKKGERPALITVYQGRIVQIQEIYTP